MAAELTAFLLNLDAEEELANPSYGTPPKVAARIASLRTRLHFLTEHDRVIGCDDLTGCTRAVAYCPTPRALSQIAAAGLARPPAPPVEVLRSVNARAFCAALGQTLPGARYVRSLAELRSGLGPEPQLLKRDFGFAGRERRQLRDGVLDRASEGFARRSFARGEGLQREPLVQIELEVCQHGYVTPHGQSILAAPQRQHCDRQGSWQGSAPLPPGTLAPQEAEALAESARSVVRALHEAGYFGPFVIDAYRYRQGATSQFQPRSELNARLSMGYPRSLLDQGLAAQDRERGAG